MLRAPNQRDFDAASRSGQDNKQKPKARRCACSPPSSAMRIRHAPENYVKRRRKKKTPAIGRRGGSISTSLGRNRMSTSTANETDYPYAPQYL